MIYNDAYMTFAGDRHPALLGAKVREGWAEIADFNDNVMKVGLAGDVLAYRDQEMTLTIGGKPRRIWLDLDYSPIPGQDGMPVGVVAVVVETTARVRAQRWLGGERERLRQMFKQASGFVAMVTGPNHVFDIVNPAFLQLIGQRNVVGKPVRAAMPDIEGQGFFEMLDQVFASGEPVSGQARSPPPPLGDHRAPLVGSGCDTRHEPESTMTDDTMPFLDALLKRGGGDFMKDLAEEVLGRLMAYDVEGQIGAGRYERNEERTTQRNGYRHRAFDTRLGTLDLKIPKLRKGSYFPGFLEPRRTTEQALVAVIQEAWIQGVSTRKVDDLVQAMGMTGISKSQVSELCKGIDDRVNSFLERPIEGDWTYLWLDATYLKVRENGRIVSVAAIIATGVNTDGRREILGLGLGPSEAAIFWLGFLRGLEKRGLRGVKLVVSDAHEGLKAAIAQVFKATWQRCRVQTIRTQLRFGSRWTVLPARRPEGDDMADLQGSIANDDALDDQLQDGLLVGEGRLCQPPADAVAERFQAGTNSLRLEALAA